MPGASWIPTLPRLITNPSPERVQDNVANALQQFANGVADGQLLNLSIDVSKVTLVGSPVAFNYLINHPLGRAPQGILLGLPNCFCTVAITPNQPGGIDLTKQIQLAFLAPTTFSFPAVIKVPLWFF